MAGCLSHNGSLEVTDQNFALEFPLLRDCIGGRPVTAPHRKQIRPGKALEPAL